MRIKLFEGFDKETLEQEVNEWLIVNYRTEYLDVKIVSGQKEKVNNQLLGKITIMVVYK